MSLEPFRCIVADPPWAERGGGRIKRGADRHYPVLSPHEIICAMLSAPVWRPDSAGCHLWLWVTDNHLLDGIAVMRALGFRYVRTRAWVKTTAAGGLRIGLGQYVRGAHELVLLGIRGRLASMSRSVPSVIVAQPTGHSTKPEIFYQQTEAISPGPRLELFARQKRPGWVAWGNEIGK